MAAKSPNKQPAIRLIRTARKWWRRKVGRTELAPRGRRDLYAAPSRRQKTKSLCSAVSGQVYSLFFAEQLSIGMEACRLLVTGDLERLLRVNRAGSRCIISRDGLRPRLESPVQPADDQRPDAGALQRAGGIPD